MELIDKEQLIIDLQSEYLDIEEFKSLFPSSSLDSSLFGVGIGGILSKLLLYSVILKSKGESYTMKNIAYNTIADMSNIPIETTLAVTILMVSFRSFMF